MSARIIDGAEVAARLRAEIAEEVSTLVRAGGRAPGLAVVLVGDNPASHVYVRNKGVATRKAGMVSTEHRLEGDSSEEALLALVAQLNADPQVDGILVQLPLPGHIRTMEKKTSTSAAQVRALVDALEALLDVFLDGRLDELNDREQKAVNMANPALAGVVDTPAAAARN